MCDKISHETYDSAHSHQHSLVKKKISAKIYRCKECGMLHITTKRLNKRGR
jgi:uncharacterized Zn finger protein